MRIKASKLRENIYRILDQVLETGVPVEIERRGKLLRIVGEKSPSRLERLEPRDYIRGAPEDLVHLDWSNPGRAIPSTASSWPTPPCAVPRC